MQLLLQVLQQLWAGEREGWAVRGSLIPKAPGEACSSQASFVLFLPPPSFTALRPGTLCSPSQLPCLLLCMPGDQLQVMRVKDTGASKGCGPLQGVHCTTVGLLHCLAPALQEARPAGSKDKGHYVPGA